MDARKPEQEIQNRPEESEQMNTEQKSAGPGPKRRGPGGPHGPRGPRGPRGPQGPFSDIDLAIMPDFPRWRTVLFKVDCFCVGVLFLLECFFSFYFRRTQIVEGQAEAIPFLLDTMVPSCIGIVILVVAALIRKRLPESDMRQNVIPIFALLVISFVLCLFHKVFLVTLAVLCVPIGMTVVFSNKMLSRLVTGLSISCVLLTMLRQYLTIEDAAERAKLLPQGAIMIGVMFAMGIVAQTALSMTEVQRKKLYDYATSIKEEQRRAEAANIAKSAFLANMSHEIRTPINAILGMNEMVLRENTNEQIEEYAKSIHSAGSSLLSLVNDVLDISKIESGKLEIVEANYDVASFIHDCYNMVAERAEKKGLSVTIESDPNIPSQMRGDEVRLRQVVTNFLSNAAKYTKKGGITLTLGGQREGDSFLLRMEVKDTGIGIKEDNLKNIFSQFTRFDLEKNRNIEGTGLGLAISKQLVDLMHGEIQVQSIYGVGSSFTVTVPQIIIDETPMGDFQKQYHDLSRENAKYHQSFEAPGAKILVVDDVEVNLKVFVNLLKATKIQVDTAKSGRQCISMATQNRYDLIFLDHMMPEMDGIETYQTLKTLDNNQNKDTPVIMLTANAISGVREQYLSYGFTDYVSKPVSGDKLENVILKYLPEEKRKPADTASAKQEEQDADLSLLERFRKAYPPVKLAVGLTTCGENEDIYIDILKTYAQDSKVKELEQLYEQKDMENYKILVHGVKSASVSVGLVSFSDKAKALEMAAKDGDWAFIEQNHAELITEYKQIVETIRSTFSD